MNAAASAKHRQTTPAYDPQMNGPLTFSVFFHVAIVVLSIVGLPYIVKEYPIVDNSIAVEIVDIAEFTQTNRAPAPKAKPEEDKAKAQPRDMPPKVDKPKAPTVTAEEPPKPMAPVKPVAEDIAPPAKETAPPEKAEPKPTPPKPKTRPTLTKPEEPAKEQEDFNSLLRNLMESEPQSVAEEAEGKGQEAAPQATLGDRMTMSEMDAVRFQLGECWKLLAGARYAENLVVEIKMTINPDRTVRDARIVDQLRYNSDSFFRAAADSAYRAVFNPSCNPLKLPPDKYNQWKVMTVRFDPREML
jgi:hypothetical protein